MLSIRFAAAGMVVWAMAAPSGAVQERGPLDRASFAALLNEYRYGDADAAVQALSRWPERKVRAESIPASAVSEIAGLVAVAMLHTEAGIARGSFGAIAEGEPTNVMLGYWGLEKIFEPHSYLAYKTIEHLISHAEEIGDEGLLAFSKSWYILAVSQCLWFGFRDCSQSLIEKGESHFGDHAEFLLLMGSLGQGTRMTRERASRIPFGHLQAMAQMPKWHFKQALKHDPGLVEARLRFGHVVHVYLNDPDALPELERALAEARAQRHVVGAYLAAFFLGELHEDEGRLEVAADHYRLALEAQRAHMASLALGQALVRLGRRDEGLDIGRLMFGNEGPGVEPVPDPYVLYHSAQYWQNASRLRDMRQQVRRAR